MKEKYNQIRRTALKLVVMSSLLTGCSPAPSVALFGATFPDWLLCTGVGCFVMLAVHVLFRRGKYRKWLEPAILVYPFMTALIAMLFWLLLFSPG